MKKPILIVEDDREIREALRDSLELEGYTVFTASNGQEAFDTLGNMERPAVILLDLMMPVMNGWQFLEAQREHDVYATIPVVVISAAGEKAKTAQAAGYIKKPIDLDALLNVVGQYS